MLRGLLTLKLNKATRIRKIDIKLEGKARTEWPEGELSFFCGRWELTKEESDLDVWRHSKSTISFRSRLFSIPTSGNQNPDPDLSEGQPRSDRDTVKTWTRRMKMPKERMEETVVQTGQIKEAETGYREVRVLCPAHMMGLPGTEKVSPGGQATIAPTTIVLALVR
jgi:hypothetical protein